MDIPFLIILALASYVATVVLSISSITLPVRRAFRYVAFKLHLYLFVRRHETADGLRPILEDEQDLDPEIETIIGYDFVSCRLCVGFWATLAICLINRVYSFTDGLAIYGLGYLFVKLERY